MKYIRSLGAIFSIAFVLAACNESPDTRFAGTWVEQDSRTDQPRYLDIQYDKGLYLIDEHVSVGGTYKVLHEVAKVESENVLSVKHGYLSLILKDGVIYYRTKSFVPHP